MSTRVLFIVPCFNEEKSLAKVVSSLNSCGVTSEDILVVNDCSTDGSAKVAHELGVQLINLPINLGIGGAVQTGYRAALSKGYDWAVQMDGDGQHPAHAVKALLAKLPTVPSSCSMVIGSRFADPSLIDTSTTRLRRIGILWLSWLTKMFGGKRVFDPTSGLRAVKKDLLIHFNRYYPVDYPEPETVVWAMARGYGVLEVPVQMESREHGKSSINLPKSFYYFFKVSLAMLIARFW